MELFKGDKSRVNSILISFLFKNKCSVRKTHVRLVYELVLSSKLHVEALEGSSTSYLRDFLKRRVQCEMRLE